MDSPFFSTYFWVATALSTPLLIYLIYLNIVAIRNRPKLQKNDIIFEDRFASGNSRKNFLTQLGGARNCLRLVVTRDLLWVTSWFPFSLITTFYDLEHIIPRNRISKIETNSGEVLLIFTDESGATRSLKLLPRNVTDFLTALNKN
jgi:hypothetical protein